MKAAGAPPAVGVAAKAAGVPAAPAAGRVAGRGRAAAGVMKAAPARRGRGGARAARGRGAPAAGAGVPVVGPPPAGRRRGAVLPVGAGAHAPGAPPAAGHLAGAIVPAGPGAALAHAVGMGGGMLPPGFPMPLVPPAPPGPVGAPAVGGGGGAAAAPGVAPAAPAVPALPGMGAFPGGVPAGIGMPGGGPAVGGGHGGCGGMFGAGGGMGFGGMGGGFPGGGAGPPTPGGPHTFGGVGGTLEGPWIVSHMMNGPEQLIGICSGCVLEIATYGPTGSPDGTAVFAIKQVLSMDGYCVALEAQYAGASNPAAGMRLAMLWPHNYPAYGALHMCRCPTTSCPYNVPNKQTVHFDTARRRDPRQCTEPWIKKEVVTACLPAEPTPMGGSLLAPAGGVDASSDQARELKKKLKEAKEKLRASTDTSPAQQLGLVAVGKHKKRKSEDSSDSEDESGFQMGSGPGGDRRLAEMAARSPGQLYNMAVSELSKHMGDRVTDSSDPDSLQGRAFTNYLSTIFFSAHSTSQVGMWKVREMRTLAAVLDALRAGALPRAADLLVQRLKACETAITTGDADAAVQLELIPRQDVGLTSIEERRVARRASIIDRKLKSG